MQAECIAYLLRQEAVRHKKIASAAETNSTTNSRATTSTATQLQRIPPRQAANKKDGNATRMLSTMKSVAARNTAVQPKSTVMQP
jgi:hypothetical protein